MNKIKEYPAANNNAEKICARIGEETDRQISSIRERSRKEADNIWAGSRRRIEEEKSAILKNSDREVAALKEKIFSTINIEKKRIILEKKDEFAGQVLNEVIRMSEGLRDTRDYISFLKKAIAEGAGVLDTEKIEVVYSELDEKLIDEDFKRETAAFAANKHKKNFEFKYQPSDFKDIGVILRSPDGRLIYDNRFLSRLARQRDEIYSGLLRG